MSVDDIARLTEREREVLRLLVRGHDLKSVARELSITATAVNERLRQARRKLGVSTSREAARILGNHESTPRFGVDRQSGISGFHHRLQLSRPSNLARSALAMTIIIAAATILSVIASNQPPPDGRAGAPVANEQVVEASAGGSLTLSLTGYRPVRCNGVAPSSSKGGTAFNLECSLESPGAVDVSLTPEDYKKAMHSH